MWLLQRLIADIFSLLQQTLALSQELEFLASPDFGEIKKWKA
jgi:hypothetical protein